MTRDLERDDPLSAARGLFNGLLLSVAFWLLFALAWWLA